MNTIRQPGLYHEDDFAPQNIPVAIFSLVRMVKSMVIQRLEKMQVRRMIFEYDVASNTVVEKQTLPSNRIRWIYYNLASQTRSTYRQDQV